MCGIAGIFAYHYAAAPADRDELVRIRDHMQKRGPDGCGDWRSQDGRVALGHRRLSIIDLSEAGAQPMATADGRFVITFNGEIYNYRELRAELEASGIRFRSHTDTEVLLHLYAVDGAAMVHRLRGMFAFAIWDTRQRELFLARDPHGIKPLYYADDGWTLRFASQVKALLAGGRIGNDPDSAGWVGYHLFGSVPEPFTIYRQIRALEAGYTLLVAADGRRRRSQYFNIAAACVEAERNLAVAPSAQPREALLDSVRHHLVADVKVGAFLSAGVDSAALVGLMRDAGHADIESVTIAFEEFRGTPQDEAPLARQIARRYGARHTVRTVTRAEFEADLPRIQDAMDQPSIDGINTWFVSKAARELGLKVAVSGLGGDELFGGYPSFASIPRWQRLAAVPSRVPGLGRLSRGLLGLGGLERRGISPKLAGLLELGGTYPGAYLLKRGLFMPWELERLMPPEMVRDGIARLEPLAHIASRLIPTPSTPFAKVAALEYALYMRNQLLRDTDWASMAHSLEVRVPLVDVPLHARIAPMLVSGAIAKGKAALAASPSLPVPDEIRDRTKTGFSTPIGTWLDGLANRTTDTAPRTRPQIDRRAHWSRHWALELASGVLPVREERTAA